jgi:hypothetical protein
MDNEQTQPEEGESDGVLLKARLAVQCAECTNVLECLIDASVADLTDLLAECPACSQTHGQRVVVPIRILVGAEVVELENLLAIREEVGAVDSEHPFEGVAAVEDGPGGS